jgi:hypothetical protein
VGFLPTLSHAQHGPATYPRPRGVTRRAVGSAVRPPRRHRELCTNVLPWVRVVQEVCARRNPLIFRLAKNHCPTKRLRTGRQRASPSRHAVFTPSPRPPPCAARAARPNVAWTCRSGWVTVGSQGFLRATASGWPGGKAGEGGWPCVGKGECTKEGASKHTPYLGAYAWWEQGRTRGSKPKAGQSPSGTACDDATRSLCLTQL